VGVRHPHLPTISTSVDFVAVARQVRDRLTERFRGLFGEELAGVCAIASHTLCLALEYRGVAASFMQGVYLPRPDGQHCWALVENKIIVDLTCRQFSDWHPNVLVTPYPDPCYEEHLRDHWALLYANAHWPLNQTPNHWRTTIEDLLSTLPR
jgi:hypothetical protein